MNKSELKSFLDLLPGDPEIEIQGKKRTHEILSLAKVGTGKMGSIWHGTPEEYHFVLIVEELSGAPSVEQLYPEDGKMLSTIASAILEALHQAGHVYVNSLDGSNHELPRKLVLNKENGTYDEYCYSVASAEWFMITRDTPLEIMFSLAKIITEAEAISIQIKRVEDGIMSY